MTNIFDVIMRVFPSDLEKIPPIDQGSRNDQMVRVVARRNAEGSVLLGKGNIVTARDKDQALARLSLD